MKGFFDFIRQQGVVGLAVGFILGGSIQKVITSLSNDIINPLLGIVVGATDNLQNIFWQIGNVKIMWGSFLNNILDFMIIASVVYVTVKVFGVDKLDLKKEKKK